MELGFSNLCIGGGNRGEGVVGRMDLCWICVGFEWICVFPISVLGAGTGGRGGVVGRMDHQIGYHNQPLFILICHFEMSFAFIDL